MLPSRFHTWAPHGWFRLHAPGRAHVLVGALWLTVAAGFIEVAAAQERHLEMEEVFARSLPNAFELAGAAPGDSGRLLLWARNQPYLLLQAGDSLRSVGNELMARPVAAALAPGDTILEVVDGLRRTILELRADGSLVRERRLGIEISVESAVRTQTGWALAGTSADGTYEVAHISPDGAVRVLYRFDSAVSSARHPVSTLVSTDGRRIFVAEVEDPFRVIVLDAENGSRVWRPFSPRSAPLPGASGDAPFWVGLPLVPLDGGFVRTFSDLRSDLRVMVLYDGAGNAVREKPIPVPLGVLAAVPRSSLIIAARRTDVLEVVGYRWRWSEAR